MSEIVVISDDSSDIEFTYVTKSQGVKKKKVNDIAASDESNDMVMNHPDIERLDFQRKLREQATNTKLADIKPLERKHKLHDSDVKQKHKLFKIESIEIDSSEEMQEKKPVKEEGKLNYFYSEDFERDCKLEEERQQQLLEQERQQKPLELERIRQEKKEKRLEEKRIAEEAAIKIRKEKALKGMKYLLGLSEKYSDFFREKVLNEHRTSKPLHERNKLQPTMADMKEAVTAEKKKSAVKKFGDINKQLKYFVGGSLREYQVEGVVWMSVLYENGLNGILADEMGLGKTIQIIALICNLMEREIAGPYLIVAPLSTLPNWQSEFQKFAPEIPVVVFHGSQVQRLAQYRQIKKNYTVGNYRTPPVVLTTYQVPLLEQNFMKHFVWQYIIVDEGHRIKNHESRLSLILRALNSSNRLLLTGTPLQNNITELWALLNFLLPQIFNNMDTFASLLMIEDVQDENRLLEQEQKNNIVSTIHKVLAPFMLRRLKKDVLKDIVPKKEINVFCPLTKLQRDLYSFTIAKNISKLLGKEEEKELHRVLNEPRKKRKCVKNKNYSYTNPKSEDELSDSDFEDLLILEEEESSTKFEELKIEKESKQNFLVRLTMQSPMIMFKKIVDHPYLVHFPLDPSEKKPTLLVDENLVQTSGKMIVLDAMLAKLKKQGHKVLIFSTLVMTLDLVEEFMLLRKYKYARLDGSHSLEQRGENIAEFNNNPRMFAFLISTRAGGLGLNLTGADTVIFFDRDWNPQCDIQAQDRCHRIGQTRPVMVYTLVTKNTIDEKIITCGHQKRLLEKIVIKDGKFKTLSQTDKGKMENDLKELQELLEKENQYDNGHVFSNKELDKLLDRSELYKIMEDMKNKQ